MIALLKVMALGVARDRGALSMAFILPPVIFLIFASIFSAIGGNEMRLKTAVLDQVNSADSQNLVEHLKRETSLRIDERELVSEQSLNDLVLGGNVDVGLIIRRDLSSAGDIAPLLVIAHGGKAVAGSILSGHVQRVIASELPHINLERTITTIDSLAGGFSPQQNAAIAEGIKTLRGDTEPDQPQEGEALVAIDTLTASGTNPAISYYAGAIAILFLLLSAMQGAATLIEERNAGIVDRLAISRAGIDTVVASKFAFLLIQGVLQIGLIFIVAWLIFDVSISGKFGPWSVVTVAAAAAAAGLGVAVASACTTKQQANTISGFLVLVVSAIGGSMVPRFMMPPWMQDIGWFTPNAWAIEAYQSLLWRDADAIQLIPYISPLLGIGSMGLAAAVITSRIRLKAG